MGVFIDETGNVYGKLVVLQRVENDKNRKACWLCWCECGNTTVVVSSRLRSGHTKSCGCLRSLRGRNLKDETDNVYGRLTVLRRAKNSKDGRVQWLCQCSCGNLAVIRGKQLRKRVTRSCGCLHDEAARKRRQLDLTNHRFGRLVAIENVGTVPGEGCLWRCICDCGNETVVSARTLRSNNTQSCGCLNRDRIIARTKKRWKDPKQRAHMLEMLSGANHPNWRGGRGRKYPKEFYAVRPVIRDRDAYRCFICNRTEQENGQGMSVHHIDGNEFNNSEFNLCALCRQCHGMVESALGFWTPKIVNELVKYYQSG